MSAFENIFSARESEKFEIFKTFYNKKDLPFKTDLSLEQITDIVSIEMIEIYIKQEWGLDYNIKNELTNPLKEHLVSLNRQGRTEMVTVFQSPKEAEGEEKKGRIRRLLGI